MEGWRKRDAGVEEMGEDLVERKEAGMGDRRGVWRGEEMGEDELGGA